MRIRSLTGPAALAVVVPVLVLTAGCGGSPEHSMGDGQLERLANANLACSNVILAEHNNDPSSLDEAERLAYGAAEADSRWSDLPTYIEATNSPDAELAANVAGRLAALCDQAQSLEADFMSQ